eukprot:362405_1
MRKDNINQNENVQSVIKRNEHFANFCGLLYETTCFFSSLANQNEVFYHGVSCKMLFDQFGCNFNMPVSTTVNKDIGYNFATPKGILLKLQSNNSSNTVYTFNVEWVSAFKEEEERLFYETTLSITNIWADAMGINYKREVKMLLLYDAITHGAFISTIKNNAFITNYKNQ